MKNWVRWVPVGAMGVFAALFLALGRELSLSELLAWTPESPALAGLFLVGLYGLKSLSLVFPLLLLYLAAGAIFPLPLAFAVNTAGLAVCVSLPFFLGRWMGVDVQGTLSRRWPKLSRLEELEREGAFRLLTLVRAMGLLPCDAVSLWFGAAGTRYGPYLAGSLAGMLPMMLAETALGAAVQAPGSWQFWTAAGCGAALAVLSLWLGYRMWRRTPEG